VTEKGPDAIGLGFALDSPEKEKAPEVIRRFGVFV
jgi:hypothetical protein